MLKSREDERRSCICLASPAPSPQSTLRDQPFPKALAQTLVLLKQPWACSRSGQRPESNFGEQDWETGALQPHTTHKMGVDGWSLCWVPEGVKGYDQMWAWPHMGDAAGPPGPGAAWREV